MSATLSVNGRVQWQDTSFVETQNFTYSVTETGGNMFKQVQTIATSDTALSFGSITPAWIVLKNLDDTNDVHHGPDSGGAIVEAGIIGPGEVTGPIRVATTTWRAIAQNASCDLLVIAFPT